MNQTASASAQPVTTGATGASAPPPTSVPATAAPRSSGRRRMGRLCRVLIATGVMAVVSFLLGASVIHWKLPGSEPLEEAFIGSKAWFEKVTFEPSDDKVNPRVEGLIDHPELTFDGYTLFTTYTRAGLLNMRGKQIYEWKKPFSEVWPEPIHGHGGNDKSKYWLGAHLFPETGEMLGVYQAWDDNPPGQGIVKIDKNNKIVWRYPNSDKDFGRTHHTVSVGPDGRVYCMAHENEDHVPKGMDFVTKHFVKDYLIILDENGEEKKKIGIIEAFLGTKYALVLNTSDVIYNMKSAEPRATTEDPTHMNSVQVLTEAMQPKFPMWKPGWLLISLRAPSIIAVLNPDTEKVEWAARGTWRGQHDAQFLDTGNLLLFDNLGSDLGTRALEFNPQTLALPWSYTAEDSPAFHMPEQGNVQRLANGNTMLIDSIDCAILELTPERKLAWFMPMKSRGVSEQSRLGVVRRYGEKEVKFLPAGTRARPK
jgi:hypothetical protein